ncbi:MAG: HAD family hydrolase [bacterium]
MSDDRNTTLRAVLLDLDGTLLASEEMDVRAMDRLFNEELSLQFSEETLHGFIGMTSEDVLRQVTPGREEQLLKRWYAIQEELRHLVRLFPGVRPALEKQRAAGRALGVVTAQSRRELEATRAHIDLEDLIDVWVCSNDTEQPKPSPEPVHLALSELGAAPSEAVMIGDTTFDLAAGRAAGGRVAAALYGALDPQALLDFGPDYVLRKPEEIGGIGD